MLAGDSGPPKLKMRQHFVLVGYVLKLIYKNHKLYTILFSASLIFSALIPAATIWIAKMILDMVALLIQGKGSIQSLLFLVGAEVGFLLLQKIMTHVNGYFTTKFSSHFSLDLKTLLLRNNDAIDYKHFEDPSFYNKFSIASQHVASSASGYLNMVVNLVRSLVMLGSVAAIVLMVDVWFMVAILALNALNFVISMRNVKKQYKLIGKTIGRQRFVDYLYQIMTRLNSIRDIKLFDMYKGLTEKFSANSKKNINLNLERQRKEMGVMFGFEMLSTIIYYGFYIYILLQVARRMLSLGDIVLFQRAYTTLDGALSGISGSISHIYESNLYLYQFYDLLHNPEYKVALGAAVLVDPIETIKFEDVCFAYPGRPDVPIITSCNGEIGQGDLVAVVGKNGAGKSTLAKLLSGLFVPSEGQILINGQSITTLDLKAYQARISTHLQDFNQYDFTVQENITSLKQPVDPGRLAKVIDFCQLSPIIEALPQDMETVLSREFQEGMTLSSGQWQRIALARALYRPADILILDEPTAHVDAAFADHFFENLSVLQSLYEMVLVVTHRLDVLDYFTKVWTVSMKGAVSFSSCKVSRNSKTLKGIA